jgi:hypothetical protein
MNNKKRRDTIAETSEQLSIRSHTNDIVDFDFCRSPLLFQYHLGKAQQFRHVPTRNGSRTSHTVPYMFNEHCRLNTDDISID